MGDQGKKRTRRSFSKFVPSPVSKEITKTLPFSPSKQQLQLPSHTNTLIQSNEMEVENPEEIIPNPISKSSIFSPAAPTKKTSNVRTFSIMEPKKKEVEDNSIILQSLSFVPLDWSIKSAAKFTSPFPFDTSFFESKFYQFIHPDTFPLHFLQQCQELLNKPEKSRQPSEQSYVDFWLQRQKAWCESFQSLFTLFKEHQCPFFYLKHNLFTILFLSPGLGGYKVFTAIITNSTYGLRERLKKENVHFSMPLRVTNTNNIINKVEPVNQKHLSITLDDILSPNPEKKLRLDINKSTPTSSSSAINESQLLFQGYEQIQSLFTFIYKFSYDEELPTLYSIVPFNNSIMRQIQIKSNGIVLRSRQSNSDGIQNNQIAESLYCLELEGPLLPSTIMQLCDLFKETQKGTFDVLFTTMKSTIGFNYFHGNPTSTGQIANPSETLSKLLNQEYLQPLKEISSLGENIIKKLVVSEYKFQVISSIN